MHDSCMFAVWLRHTHTRTHDHTSIEYETRACACVSVSMMNDLIAGARGSCGLTHLKHCYIQVSSAECMRADWRNVRLFVACMGERKVSVCLWAVWAIGEQRDRLYCRVHRQQRLVHCQSLSRESYRNINIVRCLRWIIKKNIHSERENQNWRRKEINWFSKAAHSPNMNVVSWVCVCASVFVCVCAEKIEK